MSPILFKALHDCPEIDLEYNAYKSDVFSLGLCMLLSSTLGFQALYDIRELYDNNKIKKIVEKYLSSRYSDNYLLIRYRKDDLVEPIVARCLFHL